MLHKGRERKRNKQRQRVTEFEGQQPMYLLISIYATCPCKREREREERNGQAESLIIGVTGSSKVNESWAEREREMPRRTLGVFSDSPAKISWHGFFQLYMWSLSVKEITIISSTLALSLNSKWGLSLSLLCF